MTLTCKGNYSNRCTAVFQNNIVRELKNIEKAFQKRAPKAKHKKKTLLSPFHHHWIVKKKKFFIIHSLFE